MPTTNGLLACFTQDTLLKVAQIITHEFGVNVVVGGNQCCTDGKTIYLPALSDEQAQNPRVIGLIRHFLDHECGHIVGKSELDIAESWGKRGPSPSRIIQLIEDIRVENLMRSRMAGCGVNFGEGWAVVMERMNKQAADKDPAASVPLTQLYIYLYSQARPNALDVEWIDPQIAQVFGKYVDRLKSVNSWAHSTKDMEPIAEEILKDYQAMVQEPEQEKSDGQDQSTDKGEDADGGGNTSRRAAGERRGNGGADSSGTGSGEPGTHGSVDGAAPSQADDGDAGGDSEGRPAQDAGAGGAADADQGEAGAGSGDDGQDAGANDPDDGATGVPGGVPGGGDSGTDGDDGPPIRAGAATATTGKGSRPGGPGGRGFTKVNLDYEASETLDVGRELAKGIEGALASGIKEAMSSGDLMSQMRFLNPAKQFPIQDLGEAQKFDEQFLREAALAGGPMRQRLSQILSSESHHGWKHGQTRGTPNPRKLAALVTGLENKVMRRRTTEEAPTTACSLVLDLSSSMGGESSRGGAWRDAGLAAAAFAQVLDSRGHPCSVIGFYDQQDGSYIYKNPNDHSKGRHDENKNPGVLMRGCQLYRGKKWTEPYQQAKHRIRRLAGNTGGGTPLAEAIIGASFDLAKRPEKRKVMVVFTDGGSGSSPPPWYKAPKPYGNDRRSHHRAQYHQQLCESIERRGIEVVLIGIGGDCVSNLHHRTAYCNDIHDLSTLTIRELEKALKRG